MATPFSDQRIDNFLKDLDKSLADGIKKKRSDKKDKDAEKKRSRAEDLFKNLSSLLRLLTPGGLKLPKEEREKLLEGALTSLVGSVTGDEKGHELADRVKDLIDIWRGTKTEAEKKKLLEDAIKKLTTKVGAGVSGAKDKEVSTLVDAVVTILKLATGQLTDADKQKVLEDNALKLLTTDLVKRQLQWFISENFMTYLAAVKVGYQLGAPIGAQIAKDLAPVIKARYGEDFLIGLEQKDPGWMERVTDGSSSVKVTLEGGSFQGWQGVAFWDYSAGAVRIQVVTPKGQVMLLDGNGVDVTGEPPLPVPTDGASDASGPVEEHGGDKVEFAMKVAEGKQPVKDAQAEMDHLKTIADGANGATVVADKTHDQVKIDAAHVDYKVKFNDYWRAREKWKLLIHNVLLQAAVAEHWGTSQFNYMWMKYPTFAVHTWEISQVPTATFTNMSNELSPEDAAKAWPAPTDAAGTTNLQRIRDVIRQVEDAGIGTASTGPFGASDMGSIAARPGTNAGAARAALDSLWASLGAQGLISVVAAEDPLTPSDQLTTLLQIAEDLERGMETGHYDDGHALGQSPQTDGAVMPGDNPDTGHYDDGHAFGWKAKGTTDGAGASTAAGAGTTIAGLSPLALVGGVAAVLAISLGAFFFASRGSSTPSPSPARTQAAVGVVATPAPTAATAAPAAPGPTAQPATAQGYRCTGDQIILFNNWNSGGVDNGGTPPTFSTGGRPYCLVFAATYHWNGGKGAPPGRIELVGGAGTVSGQAEGSGSQVDWVYNAPADARALLNGSYTCRDSDPSTWASNAQSTKQGFCKVIVQNAVR